MRDNVSNFVAQYSCKPVLVFTNWQDACVDKHFPSVYRVSGMRQQTVMLKDMHTQAKQKH